MARFLSSMTRLYSSTSNVVHLKPYGMCETFSSSDSMLNKNPSIFSSKWIWERRYINSHSSMHKDNNNVKAPLPSQAPSNSSRNWILGIVLTIIFPFSTNKYWGPWLEIKNEVDITLETVEQITKVVEKTADVVDRAAENIDDHLPEGGKIRKTVDFIENVAEEAAKDAHLVGDIIDKVQGVEEEVESIVESLNVEARKPSKL